MFPNLKAELSRGNITLLMLSKELGLTIGTISQKLNGKYPITLAEAKKIKDLIKRTVNADIPLEVLFEEAS